MATDITDGFNGLDIGIVAGAGMEFGRLALEWRYSRGLRRVNDEFNDLYKIKSHSFAALVGRSKSFSGGTE